MFHQTAKTKGKTAKNLPIPGQHKKAAKSTPAHKRGHVAPQQGVKTPQQLAQDSVDQDSVDMTDDEAAEGGVVPGELDEEHENEGGPCAENIEDMPSIADAIKSINSKRKSSRKYDPGTNTYR